MTPFKPQNKIKKQIDIDDGTLNTLLIIVATIIVMLIVIGAYFLFAGINQDSTAPSINNIPTSTNSKFPFRYPITVEMSYDTENAEGITGISSQFALLLDATSGEILAGSHSGMEMHPASMTKVMTLIVVIENLKSEDAFDDMVMVTEEHISNKTNDRKVSGEIGGQGSPYPAGEYPVKTLLYHLILNSDGVAALALADYIAGSEANFVKLMNEKADELQLERTNFVYCDGSHSSGHISTCKDMAKIMAYAMKNPQCAEILTSQIYDFNQDKVPECYHSLLVSLLHNDTPSKKIRIKTANVIAGKTGWTDSISKGESGGCIVSYAKGTNGREYIVVVAGAPGANYSTAINEAVKDIVTIYENYIKN